MAEQRAKVATKKVDLESQSLTIDFVDGADAIVVGLSELPQTILPALALHGLSQKMGDSYSGEQLPSEARAKAADVLERLLAGEWSVRRERGPGSTSLTIEAIAALRSLSTDQVKAVWESLDDDQKKAIRADDTVKAKMAEIKAARLAEKAKDSGGEDDILATFGDAA